MVVSVKTSFDAAHILQGYQGKCGNLHGHTYKLEVVAEASRDSMGMVVDYNVLKPVVESVVKYYDHAFLCGEQDAPALERVCRDLALKIKYVNGYSTTENLASQILKELVLETTKYGWGIVKVRLSETDSTYAEVESWEVFDLEDGLPNY